LASAAFSGTCCMTEGAQVQGITPSIAISCRADGALGGMAGKGEEQRHGQQAGSVMQALAADWKHPSILLLIALASWYSKEESSCKLSILNAVLLLMIKTLPHDPSTRIPSM
jgi:hypothetical protein